VLLEDPHGGRQSGVLGLQLGHQRLEGNGIIGQRCRAATWPLLPEMVQNRQKNAVFQSNKSANTRRRSAPGWTAPVDPFPQHRQLRAGQPSDRIATAGPRKGTFLQNLIIQAKPLAVPVQQLEPVALTSAKAKTAPLDGF
jgi:hypothetical protein